MMKFYSILIIYVFVLQTICESEVTNKPLNMLDSRMKIETDYIPVQKKVFKADGEQSLPENQIMNDGLPEYKNSNRKAPHDLRKNSNVDFLRNMNAIFGGDKVGKLGLGSSSDKVGLPGLEKITSGNGGPNGFLSGLLGNGLGKGGSFGLGSDSDKVGLPGLEKITSGNGGPNGLLDGLLGNGLGKGGFGSEKDDGNGNKDGIFGLGKGLEANDFLGLGNIFGGSLGKIGGLFGPGTDGTKNGLVGSGNLNGILGIPGLENFRPPSFLGPLIVSIGRMIEAMSDNNRCP